MFGREFFLLKKDILRSRFDSCLKLTVGKYSSECLSLVKCEKADVLHKRAFLIEIERPITISKYLLMYVSLV